jgi:hypothetical protein
VNALRWLVTVLGVGLIVAVDLYFLGARGRR